MDRKNFDPHASMILAIGYVGALGAIAISNGIWYTKPVVNPPIFQPFTAIQPQLSSTMRISNMTDFVDEEGSVQTPNSRCVTPGLISVLEC